LSIPLHPLLLAVPAGISTSGQYKTAKRWLHSLTLN